MSLAEHVSISIVESNVSVTRLGFGTPLILSVNATFGERLRYYTSLTSVVADGFVTTSPEYLAARAIMSQNPSPERFAIGRAIGKPTQTYALSITSAAAGNTYGINVLGTGVTATACTYTSLANFTFVDADVTVASDTIAEVAHGMNTGDGPFRLTSTATLPAGLALDTNYWIIATTADAFKLASSKANATALTAVDITGAIGGGTHTVARANNDTIVAQLVQDLNATVGKNFTAVHNSLAGETDTITVTGNAAGNWFSLEVTNANLIKCEQTHAEPATTLATDLAAIATENPDWYGLTTLYNSDAYVKAAAAWIETQKKIYIADISATECATLADGGADTANSLQTLAYTRTAVAYHPSPGAMLGAAWFGTRLPFDPGAETWKFARPKGVASVLLTATHRVNLRAKAANVLETVGGVNIMWEGTTADGDFIDTTRGLDWLEDDMTTSVFGAMAGALKVPYTNAGLAFIENQIRGSLTRAIARGILSPDLADKPIITMPKIANISSADKGVRLLPDVKWSARLAGAVHRIKISGTVSV